LKTVQDEKGPAWRWVAVRREDIPAFIYVPDAVPESVFVITAYALGAKALRALRRRRRRKS